MFFLYSIVSSKLTVEPLGFSHFRSISGDSSIFIKKYLSVFQLVSDLKAIETRV